jgi:hypothetical protein
MDSKRFWRASPVSRARRQMRDQAQTTLVDIVDRPIETKAVSQFLDKLERGLGLLAGVRDRASGRPHEQCRRERVA